jgi:uncharacterized protein
MDRIAARRDGRGYLPVLAYFAVAFGWTWALWWTTAAFSRLPAPLSFLLFMTGGLGPLVGAAWVVRRGGTAYRRRFLRRVWDPRGIPAHWWLALVAVAAVPAVLGAVVASISGAAATLPDYGVGAVGGVVAFAVAAGLVEEPGWRGVASDAWQERTRSVWAATGIGVLWALWHLPLHFIEGSYQHGLGFGSVRFWLTNLVLIQLSVLYVWLANGSGGSILVAILAHAGFNAAGEFVPRSTTGDVVAFLTVTTITVAVIAATRGHLCLPAVGARGPTGPNA